MISICIPAYNCAKYIKETIESLLKQSYTDIEIIIINDGSTDNTLSIIKNVIDDRIIIIDVQNGGAAKARNIAFNHSKGHFIVFFDADDLICEHFLKNQLNTIKGLPTTIAVSQWARFYDDNLLKAQLISNPAYSMNLQTWVEEYWYQVKPMTNPGRFLIPREIIKKAGLWNESLSLNDDMEFFTRIFAHSTTLIFNNLSTMYYRSGINGLSGNMGSKAYRSLYKSIKMSTDLVLEKYHTQLVKQACANLWQNFIFDIYPKEKPLIKLAEKEIQNLIAPSFNYPAGGLTKMLINILGWKLTKRLKFILQ